MTRRAIIVTLALALVATGCGRSDDGTDGATPTPTTDATGDGALDDGTFGDLGTICSAGDATPVTGQTGIDGTTIHVATFTDRGFAGRPGLNEELIQSAEAFARWCNAHGGIRGYQLAVDERDAKLFEYQQRMTEACTADFMAVGGGGAFDDTGEKTRLACALPMIPAFTVGKATSAADLLAPPVPSFGGAGAIGDLFYLAERYPEAASKVAIVTGNIPAATISSDRNKAGAALAGMTVVDEEIYNAAGEASWRPFAQALADKGVRGVMYTGEPINLALLMAEFDTVGFSPDWVRIDPNGYDDTFRKEGGADVLGVYIRTAMWPFEEADARSATHQYLSLLERYRPGSKVALLGVQSWSAMLLFAQAVGACVDNDDLTRDCVYASAKDHDDWTGGGLHAPSDVAQAIPSRCYTLLQVAADGFERVADLDTNEGVFNCDDRNLLPLPDELAFGARCPSGKENPRPSEC